MFRLLGKLVILPLAALAGWILTTAAFGALMGTITGFGVIGLDVAVAVAPYVDGVGAAGATIAVLWVIFR